MIWFLISLLIAAAIAAVFYKLSSRNLMSPGVMFCLFWYLPFSISFLELSDLQGPYSSLSLFVIIVITILMTVVLMAADIFLIGKIPMAITAEKIRRSIRTIKWDALPILLSLLLITFFVTGLVYLVEFDQIGIPILEIDDEIIRRIGGKIHRFGKDSKLQIILSADYLVGAVTFIGYLVSARFKVPYALLASVPIFTGLLKLSKSDILEPVVTYAIIGYFITWGTISTPKMLKRLLLVIGGFFILFGFLVYVRENRLLKTSAPLYSESIEFSLGTGITALDESMAFYYGYGSLNFVNFDRALQRTPKYMLGLSLFRPLYTVTLQSERIDEVKSSISHNPVSRASVVGTFMRDLYIEGGILMIFLGALAYSSLIAFVYCLARLRPSIYTLILFASFGFPFIWLFFQNAFANLNFFTSPIMAIGLTGILATISRYHITLRGASSAR